MLYDQDQYNNNIKLVTSFEYGVFLIKKNTNQTGPLRLKIIEYFSLGR